MKKLILRCQLALGDVVLLTAAVRDLHCLHPRLFQTDVRTPFPEVWTHNPLLVPLHEYEREVAVADCGLPLIQQSNEAACHALHGFMDFLNDYLGTRLRPTAFRGDIHLSRAETAAPSPAAEAVGREIPFWVIASGGKLDATTKWWAPSRYQEVVDHYAGRIQFVQVGHAAHHHPKLRGVIDLRGRLSLRDLIRLIHHSQGVLCGVTSLMHLAAALPAPPGRPANRPCVVVAGGRESPHWEAYPGHQFIHTVGLLPCCATGGCWKSRTVPLGDGDERDARQHLCVDARHGLPRCLDLITSAEVIRRIDLYLAGGAARVLTIAEAKAARRGVEAAAHRPAPRVPLSVLTARAAAARHVAGLPGYPGGFAGRGLVMCAGGPRLFTNAWVSIQMLRRLGCTLPLQLWHLGPREFDDRMRALIAPLGVECVDAMTLCRRGSGGLRHGWALKPFALLHCPFEEVLLLDADNVPVRNPEYLFDSAPFRRTGAVFWPDYEPLGPEHRAWRLFGVPYRREPAVESGQVLVNKRRCWKALRLVQWYNDHCDFYYEHVHGDKDTFHLAFRKLGQPYAMPRRPPHRLVGVMCQHDFLGRRLFQHRTMSKWSLFPVNRRTRGFRYEAECLAYLEQLRRVWDGRIGVRAPPNPSGPAAIGAEPPALAACLVSCSQRDPVRQETLDRLRRTDWGDTPVRVHLDEKRFRSSVENLTHTAWRALQEGVREAAAYLLFLEDDLGFNRHFRHNLLAWDPLRQGQVDLATLYNPGHREINADLPRRAATLDPHWFFGSQALVMSRAMARYFIEHWWEGPPELDLKLASLLNRAGRPLLAHCPSLVQHVGRASVCGGPFHQAADFDGAWRAPADSTP